MILADDTIFELAHPLANRKKTTWVTQLQYIIYLLGVEWLPTVRRTVLIVPVYILFRLRKTGCGCTVPVVV